MQVAVELCRDGHDQFVRRCCATPIRQPAGLRAAALGKGIVRIDHVDLDKKDRGVDDSARRTAVTARSASGRMNDLPSVEVSTTVDAALARVWALVSDIAILPAFSTELQSVAWIDGVHSPVLGATFKGVNTHPAMGTWTTRSTIVAFEPPNEFAWAVGDLDNRAATWRFVLAGRGDVTQLRYRVQIGPGPSGVSMLIARRPQQKDDLIANRLQQFHDNMARTLRGIKALAEDRH